MFCHAIVLMQLTSIIEAIIQITAISQQCFFNVWEFVSLQVKELVMKCSSQNHDL